MNICAFFVFASLAITMVRANFPIPEIPFDMIEMKANERRQEQPPFFQPLLGERVEVDFVSSQGLNRTYVVYYPSTLVDGVPAPLVFSYHGFGSTPRQQELLCFFSYLAESHRFIAVYPEGTGRSHNSGPSCCPPAYPSVDDVQNAKDIIVDVNSTHPVDPARVYSTGMSNGGYMSTRLACDAADVFAAVANVAGANPWPDMDNCQPSRPIPYLHFHGDSDPTVGYDSAVETMEYFLTNVNGCNSNSGTVTYSNGDSECVAYSGCVAHGGQGINNVTMCTVTGGLHAWPGNPVYQQGTLDLYASPEIINFFLRYTLY